MAAASSWANNFYPRPPRGGRPGALRPATPERWISIHALREEGDTNMTATTDVPNDFYPRPPRGGRPDVLVVDYGMIIFLSTPSARRATGTVWR